MSITKVHASAQLREWLRRDHRTEPFSRQAEFYFDADEYASVAAHISGSHHTMSAAQLEVRTALQLIRENRMVAPPSPTVEAIRAVYQTRTFWEVLFAVGVLLLLLAIAVRGHAQATPPAPLNVVKPDAATLKSLHRYKQLQAKFTARQTALQRSLQHEIDEFNGLQARLASACGDGWTLNQATETCVQKPVPPPAPPVAITPVDPKHDPTPEPAPTPEAK